MTQASPIAISANDFRRQWQDISKDALDAVERVGSSGWLILGQEVSSFEREFSDWWGIPHAVGVASGLDALEIALRCAGIREGDGVITSPFSAFATTLAIMRAGAQPIWCDVDDSGGLALDRVEELLASDRSIKALVPVHLYGHPLDPDRLARLQVEDNVVVVEDCAQSAGAERAGRPTGLAGVAAATSLYPTKNLGALGDGGVLLTSDPELAESARRLRDYGQESRYRHVEVGLNSRLDELHAGILRSALLPRLDGWLRRRAEIAARYTKALRGSGLSPITPSGGRSAYHLFPVQAREHTAEDVVERFARRGVMAGRHYPFVAPDQPAVARHGRTVGSLDNARKLASREISLPIHPYLSENEVDLVLEACLELGA